MATEIYKIQSEIWAAKTSKFRCDFAQLRHLIANISGTQKDIINRKMALQTADTPAAQANLIQCTYGPQTSKNRTGVLTHPTGGHQAGHCHAFSVCLS